MARQPCITGRPARRNGKRRTPPPIPPPAYSRLGNSATAPVRAGSRRARGLRSAESQRTPLRFDNGREIHHYICCPPYRNPPKMGFHRRLNTDQPRASHISVATGEEPAEVPPPPPYSHRTTPPPHRKSRPGDVGRWRSSISCTRNVRRGGEMLANAQWRWRGRQAAQPFLNGANMIIVDTPA